MKTSILVFSVLYVTTVRPYNRVNANDDIAREQIKQNLSKTVNVNHRLFQNIDMPKLCDDFRVKSDNLLVQAIHSISNEYDVVDNIHLHSEIKTFRARGCNLTRVGVLERRVFLTAPLAHSIYNRNSDKLVAIFCLHTNQCHFMAISEIENFQQKYPILEMHRYDVNYLNIVPDIVSSIHWNHNIFKNIDMNRFCRDLRTLGLKQEQFQFNPQAQVNWNFNISKISAIHKQDGTWHQIPAARNCKLEYANGDLVYVTAPPNLPEYMLDVENTVVIFRCTAIDLRLCHFICVVTITNFTETYPIQKIVLDGTRNYFSQMAIPGQVNTQHNIFQNINMLQLCDELRFAFKGYLLRDINTSQTQFRKHDNTYRIRVSELQSEIINTVRECQLIPVDRPSHRIMVTALPTEQFQNEFVVLTCSTLDQRCTVETIAMLSDFKAEYPPITFNFSALPYVINPSLLCGVLDISHRVFQNINVEKLCEDIRPYLNGNIIANNPNLLKHTYDIRNGTNLFLELTKSLAPILSRSCKLTIKNQISNRLYDIYLTVPPITVNNNSVENAVSVLSCDPNIQNYPCFIYVTLTSPDLRSFYPDRDMVAQYIDSRSLISLPENMTQSHGILHSPYIDLFCKSVLYFSEGLYVIAKQMTNDGYNINSTNRIKTSEGTLAQTPILSRSCQLLKATDVSKEIFVTAPPQNDPKYVPTDSRVLILSCAGGVCEEETTLLVEDFEQKYPSLYETALIGMRYDHRLNKSQLLEDIYEKRIQVQHRLFEFFDIDSLCKEISKFSQEKYKSAPDTTLPQERYNQIFSNILYKPPTYIPFYFFSRSCRLVWSLDDSYEIFVSPPPPVEATYAPLNERLILYACKHFSCFIQNSLLITNFEIRYPRYPSTLSANSHLPLPPSPAIILNPQTGEIIPTPNSFVPTHDDPTNSSKRPTTPPQQFYDPTQLTLSSNYQRGERSSAASPGETSNPAKRIKHDQSVGPTQQSNTAPTDRTGQASYVSPPAGNEKNPDDDDNNDDAWLDLKLGK